MERSAGGVILMDGSAANFIGPWTTLTLFCETFCA
jgi:hypothetical protein